MFGVLGDPVAHSLSPLIHNLAFRAAGLNCVYLPFRVPRADLATFLKEFDRIPVQGYSVTIPHKEAAAALAKHQDDAVIETQAANTLVRGSDGLHAYNTDYQGVLDSLRANLGRANRRPSSADRGAGRARTSAARRCTTRRCWCWAPAAWPGPWRTPCTTRGRW